MLVTNPGSVAQLGQSGWLLTSRSGVQIPSGPPNAPERKHGFEYNRLLSKLDRVSRHLSKHQWKNFEKD